MVLFIYLIKKNHLQVKTSVTWINGQKGIEGYYKYGKKDGKWTKWYENGQIESEGNYKDGKKDGKWTEWYTTGRKGKIRS